MVIYWCAYTENDTVSQFDFIEPTVAVKRSNEYVKNLDTAENFTMCPAFRDHFNNVFELNFPTDYNLNFEPDGDGTRISSTMYDQKYFDEMVYIRSGPNNLYSYNVRYMFYCEEPLTATMTPAYFAENDFTKNTMLVSGKFNVGKWFRPFDCAFKVHDGVSHFKIEKNQPFAYIHFDTNQKIEFKRFYRSDKIAKLHHDLFRTRNFRQRKIVPLDFFYNIYNKIKFSSIIKKEIENNLMD